MRPLSITFLVFCFILPLHFLSAQVVTKTGEIFGTVADEKKLPLSGVLVTVESREALQQDTTGRSGGFRFINLPPGVYTARIPKRTIVKIPGNE